MDRDIKIIVAMVCIVVIQLAGLYTHQNHTTLAATIAVLAGLGGYELARGARVR